MENKPLLIFPRPAAADWTRGTPRPPGGFHKPSKEEQIKRIGPVITELDKVLTQKSLFLQQNIANTVPEMVLVLEIRGTIDNFFSAVKKTPGLEFLAEYEEDYAPDESFYALDKSGQRKEKEISGQLFLVMTNQKALRQLKKYWDLYQKDGSFKHGTAKFRTLFKQLSDIRPYSVKDRLRDTGFLEYLKEQKEHETENLRFEIELFYRDRYQDRQRAYKEIRTLLSNSDGQVVESSLVDIKEIRYHAFIAEAPVQVFDNLADNTNVAFLQCEHVMFLRPVGQIAISVPGVDKELADLNIKDVPMPTGEPVVALLDGLPLANHAYLQNRIQIDDPDSYDESYQASERLHGTTMASLIIHGELDDHSEQPLKRPLYVRPIMKPDEEDTFHSTRREIIPRDRLPIDLIHRAVRRMKEGEQDDDPVAPHIKVINLSIGDPVRPFHINLSTWAKLLDWLSYKYEILFIVSAGNCHDNIYLNTGQQTFSSLTEAEKQKLVLESIINSNSLRKILTPAESLNALTVGASCYDSSNLPHYNSDGHLIYNKELLSPYSRIGFGFKMGIKPDILMPGGRMPYRIDRTNFDSSKTIYTVPPISISSNPPGQRVAIPGQQGEVNKAAYTSGTSNAAALTTRLAARLYDLLSQFNQGQEVQINENYFAVLIKALIVHGASWNDAKGIIEEILKGYSQIKPVVRRNHICTYLGNGLVNANRVLYCTEQRVTLLGYGELEKEKAHLYHLPLPYSLSQDKYWKRLVITLAWLTPLNVTSNKYRKARLYFDNLNPSDRTKKNEIPLNLVHENAGYDIGRKGTVQHDVLEGDELDAFIDGTNLSIKVNCKQDAGGLGKEKIKYGLAVTLEVSEKVQLPIYQEIQQAIKQRIKISS